MEPEKLSKFSVNELLSKRDLELNIPHDGSMNLYLANKYRKLIELNEVSKELIISDIFTGCACFVNGVTNPSLAELRRLITIHGGVFDSYQIPSTTHMICDGFSEAKTALIRKKVGRNHSSLFYVTAAWVVDSIQAGKRLSEGLFPPRGLKELNGKSMQSFIRKSVDGNDKEGEEEVNNVLRNYDFDSTKILRQIGSGSAKESSIAESVVNPLASRSTAALNTSDDPNFLSHFFANSRLHFIGTWRNRLPQFAKRLMIKHPHLTEGRKGLSSRSCDEPSERLVLHIDMDCFFVSVLLRSHPHLVHKPVAVAHGYSAGCEVSSCNYPARALGVKNGMWMQSAKLLCPELVVLKYDFSLYETVSEQVYNIFYSTPEAIIVQPVSVDEAYIEVRPDVDALALAAKIRERVYSETQCPCSAGIGPNMLLAKIATKRAKPDGQFQISYQNLGSILYDLPTNELPGVGWKVSRTLADHQLHCIRDLVLLSESELQSIAGVSMGSFLFRACRGMDERELVAIPARSSVSIDVNWGLRFQENAKAEEFLGQLAFETTRRLDEAGLPGGKTVTVKILKRKADAPIEPAKFMGSGLCDSFSRSQTVRKSVRREDELCPLFISLFRKLMDENGINAKDLRGIGVQVGRFEEVIDEDPGKTLTRWLRREATVDATDALLETVPQLPPPNNLSCPPNSIVAIDMTDEVIDLAHGSDESSLTPSQVLFLASLPPDLAMEQRRLLLKPSNTNEVGRHLTPIANSPRRKIASPNKSRSRQRKIKVGGSTRNADNKIQVDIHTSFQYQSDSLKKVSLFDYVSSRGKVGAVSSSSSAFSHNQSDAFSSDAGDSLLSGFSFDESSTFTMRDEKTTSCYDKEQSYNGGWKAGTLIDFERSLRDKINYCAEENVPLSSEEVDTLLAYGTWLMTSGQYDLAVSFVNVVQRVCRKAEELGRRWGRDEMVWTDLGRKAEVTVQSLAVRVLGARFDCFYAKN